MALREEAATTLRRATGSHASSVDTAKKRARTLPSCLSTRRACQKRDLIAGQHPRHMLQISTHTHNQELCGANRRTTQRDPLRSHRSAPAALTFNMPHLTFRCAMWVLDGGIMSHDAVRKNRARNSKQEPERGGTSGPTHQAHAQDDNPQQPTTHRNVNKQQNPNRSCGNRSCATGGSSVGLSNGKTG